MPSERPLSRSTLKVLAAFVENPGRELYGLELAKKTKLQSGSLYPILRRLEKAGWLTSAWEDIDEQAEGRPKRKYYEITGLGETAGRAELARLRDEVGGLRVLGALSC